MESAETTMVEARGNISTNWGQYTSTTDSNITSIRRTGLLSMMSFSISKQGQEALQSLVSRETMYPLLLLCILFFVQSWSGAVVIFFYGVSIFQVIINTQVLIFNVVFN